MKGKFELSLEASVTLEPSAPHPLSSETMKITCQSCQSKYTVSDDKVQGKTVKIKCRKCGATIVVNSSGATTGGDAAPASQSGAQQATEGGYLVNVNDGDQRSKSAVARSRLPLRARRLRARRRLRLLQPLRSPSLRALPDVTPVAVVAPISSAAEAAVSKRRPRTRARTRRSSTATGRRRLRPR
jgi:predicted Zn finger-like uncharacterized protein